MSEALRAGSTVTFFPEAQSTPGDELLHFFPRFFEPVHAIQGKALCLSIEWVSIGREKIHVGNRERILWFRQNSLFRHLLGLCANDRVEIRVRGSLVESARFPDAKTFSRACRETVLSNWKPITNAVRVRRVGLRVGRYVEPAEAIRRRE